jgi:hypothetical protein
MVAVDTSDESMPPTQARTTIEATAQLAVDRHASAEASHRIRMASNIAYIQSLTPLAHIAAAAANITGSSVPDTDILCATVTLSDLVRLHTHAILNLWALFYIMACLLNECSPGQFNTTRLRSICADITTFDRYLARQIEDQAPVTSSLSASASSPTNPANPAAIALAYPFLASNALALVAE